MSHDVEEFGNAIALWSLPLMYEDALNFSCTLEWFSCKAEQDMTVPKVLHRASEVHSLNLDGLLLLYIGLDDPHARLRVFTIRHVTVSGNDIFIETIEEALVHFIRKDW